MTDMPAHLRNKMHRSLAAATSAAVGVLAISVYPHRCDSPSLSLDRWQRGIDDPMVDGGRPIVGTVIIEPVRIEQVAIEPIDVRVAFVSTDFSWAAYYYSVGADGELHGVSVAASYEDSTIATFVADHGSDPGVEVYDDGYSWYITGFPVESAPPMPATSESWGWSESESVDESGWEASPVIFASLDGTAVQRGFTPQQSGPGTPRLASGASSPRPTGELTAAAMWMNLSGGDVGSVQLPGGKRRSR